MADNFQIKKTNFLSIIEGDISRSGIFEKWIRFLNEGSIAHYALTHSVSPESLLIILVRRIFWDSSPGYNAPWMKTI